MQGRKRDRDVHNRLLDSMGEGEGGMIWENSIETCILSSVKQITSPGWMHETSAQGWCTGKTQRDGTRELRGESCTWTTSSPAPEGLQEDGRRRSAGASAMVTGYSLACSWVCPSPLLHPWLHPPHEVVTSNLGKGKENEAALGRGRMTTLGPL